MNNSLVELLLVILGIWIVIGLIFIVFLVAFAFFAVRWFSRFISPDLTEMNSRLAALQAANPGKTTDALVRKIIGQQALKAGMVGAITGLGGFITLPITLPIDLVASLRIQATMVNFIAMLYGHINPDSDEMKLQTYLVMSGGTEATEMGFGFLMRIVVRVLGETFSIFVPVFGVIVGFGVNYFIAQATGNIAMRWYSSHAPQELIAQGTQPRRLKDN